MTQDYIRIIARKFLEGTATEEEKLLLHQWYDRNGQDESEPEIVLTRQDEHAADVKARMFANIQDMQQHRARKWWQAGSVWLWGAAAAMLLITVFFRITGHQSASEAMCVVHAPLGKTLRITLPDSSRVWLNAGSSLMYPRNFSSQTREVVLKEGQAFFDIVHVSARPFVVHAKTLNITVLGTSFDVKAYRNDPDIKVTVKTGKVGVTLRDEPGRPAVMLLPAEQAVVPEKSAEVRVSEVSKPAIAPWKDNRLVFEDELLSEVFHALERKYNQHIVIENTMLPAERITLTLDNQPVADVLKVLSFSKKFNYSQLNDSTIVIR
ncbi:FecR family protein [Dyadobacter sandarakinus]|uniref:FecR domain-containing protein n=1 Tax=Dyadobacter sandarakinus TaxID=2747268 RepID=A0ABX7I7H4_9BACT|nr:FecR family protein [Dyadobacter sandarakinus]QRR02057.1 FecR domain-containing protein [Dyadobacter sandarakinus]